jgi:hypothetical protein
MALMIRQAGGTFRKLNRESFPEEKLLQDYRCSWRTN